MQINPKIKKIGILIEKIIFGLLRLYVIAILVPLLTFTVLEKIENDYSVYPWRVEGLSWNYANEYYYKASSNYDLIVFSIILIVTIFAHKLPRYVFYVTVLLFAITETLFGRCCSIDNPPTWILDIF